MRILMVGNDPHDIGGVMNYTRPLAVEFSKKGHDVYYLYSGAWNRKYNWLIRPYLKIQNKEFPFKYAALINSPNWAQNFGYPIEDISSPVVERLFNRYLDRVKPDVMHVHSRIGLPTSIMRIAAQQGIHVFTTIHSYGMLCQKSVMIDSHGDPCEGPSNLGRCVACTSRLNIAKLKFAARIGSTSILLLKLLVKIKKKLRAGEKGPTNRRAIIEDRKLEAGLKKRLEHNINLMNTCVNKNLCVSSDVKRTLMRYGVNEDKLFVQHIGSVIAEGQTPNNKGLHTPIVLGNIGGVGHYKGTHVLVEAIEKMSNNGAFIINIYGKYEKDYVRSIMKGREHLPIRFLGKYRYEDLPALLKEIDVMVLPSICKDTAPQTIFESYSAGIPIVASNTGGFPDFVQHGENGLLFLKSDSTDLAEKVEALLKNPNVIISMRTSIPRLKTIAENAAELITLYHERCS